MPLSRVIGAERHVPAFDFCAPAREESGVGTLARSRFSPVHDTTPGTTEGTTML